MNKIESWMMRTITLVLPRLQKLSLPPDTEGREALMGASVVEVEFQPAQPNVVTLMNLHRMVDVFNQAEFVESYLDVMDYARRDLYVQEYVPRELRHKLDDQAQSRNWVLVQLNAIEVVPSPEHPMCHRHTLRGLAVPMLSEWELPS